MAAASSVHESRRHAAMRPTAGAEHAQKVREHDDGVVVVVAAVVVVVGHTQVVRALRETRRENPGGQRIYYNQIRKKWCACESSASKLCASLNLCRVSRLSGSVARDTQHNDTIQQHNAIRYDTIRYNAIQYNNATQHTAHTSLVSTSGGSAAASGGINAGVCGNRCNHCAPGASATVTASGMGGRCDDVERSSVISDGAECNGPPGEFK